MLVSGTIRGFQRYFWSQVQGVWKPNRPTQWNSKHQTNHANTGRMAVSLPGKWLRLFPIHLQDTAGLADHVGEEDAAEELDALPFADHLAGGGQ